VRKDDTGSKYQTDEQRSIAKKDQASKAIDRYCELN